MSVSPVNDEEPSFIPTCSSTHVRYVSRIDETYYLRVVCRCDVARGYANVVLTVGTESMARIPMAAFNRYHSPNGVFFHA